MRRAFRAYASDDILAEARKRRGRLLDATKAHGGVRDQVQLGLDRPRNCDLDLDGDCGAFS